MKFLKRNWPVVFLIAVELVLFFLNYTSGTWLAGWDNIMPEFAPKLNFLRSFFGIWQEHRGLGYADGMSHAAGTLHTLVIWVLTTILPLPLVRYTFVFLTHLLGGMGAYVLINKLIPNTFIALAGALYYLFNYATIQIYSVPFESFIIQFATLPWLIWGLIRYLDKPSKKTYLLFVLTSIAASAQYFVPTLFLGVTMLFLAVLLSHLLKYPSHRTKILFIVLGTYLVSNFYWLAPYVATLPRTATVIKNAKFNEMSSENVILNNQTRGTFLNVITLRGHVLDADMPNQRGVFGYFFTPIRDHADSLPGILTALVLPILACVAIFSTRMRKYVIGIAVSCSIFIFLLGSNIIGISTIHEYIRQAIPIVSEAFRDPFTKFSIPLAFCFALLGSIGLWTLSSRIVILLALSAILYMSIPFGNGYFIHPYMRISIPTGYLELFTYMKSQPMGRIATFPQTTFWSWRTTDYGYTGSGFTWYGIPQPTMDRSFDPWSRENENYYWEITYAVYKKDIDLFTDVLRKYNISYVLIDESTRALFGQTHALYFEELVQMLEAIPQAKQRTKFGKLTLYAIDNTQGTIHIVQNLPDISPVYSYGDYDAAYNQFGNYISSTANPDVTFAFRPLFSKRGIDFSGVKFSESFEGLQITDQQSNATLSLDKNSSLRFSAIAGSNLEATFASPCNQNKKGKAFVTNERDEQGTWIRYESWQGNACMTVGANSLEQSKGYIVAIVNRHIKGKRLLVSIANSTARHTEMDNFLTDDPQWHTDYFILPPLAKDGIGYSVYFTNEAKGNESTINDVKEVRFYEFPYDDLVHLHTGEIASSPPTPRNDIEVWHPNPAYYKVQIDGSRVTPGMTIILSQSFDTGWLAYDATNKRFLKNHVLVNNWSNGWILPSNQVTNNQLTILIFFWPQILEFIGFMLIPIPFVWLLLKRNR